MRMIQKPHVSPTRVTLGRNETATVMATVYVDPQTPPRTTNSLVVSAASPRGDTSHASAHISVSPRVGIRCGLSS